MLTTNTLDSSGATILAVTGGLLYLVERRRAREVDDYHGFGVWAVPPRWAQALFGSLEGRIRWDRMCLEAMCLTWLVLGLGAALSGAPPNSATYVALGCAGFFMLCVSAAAGGFVGIMRRRRR